MRAGRRTTRRAARKATKPKAAKRAARKAARKTKKVAKRRTPKGSTKKRAAKKTRKPKKPKRVTKKSQTGKKIQVWNGTRQWTSGGLTKADLMMNKRGRIVSKKASRHAKKAATAKFWAWGKAVMAARAELKINGFCKINKGAQGVALYKRAKEIFSRA